MRRKWYLGFGIIILVMLLTLVMVGHERWFLVILIPLILLSAYDLLQKKTRHFTKLSGTWAFALYFRIYPPRNSAIFYRQ